jgi:hypothetical protein
MGMVQIDENELKILREERDSAKAQVTTLAAEKAAAEKTKPRRPRPRRSPPRPRRPRPSRPRRRWRRPRARAS